MIFVDAYKKKSILKAATKQTQKARNNEGPKAEQLYNSAYQGFADVINGDLIMGEALYKWGFALLHQAKSMDEEKAVKPYLDAISKFTFCLLVEPNYLGAAIDGGVAYMDLARLMQVDANDELYDLAKEFFDNAERIQRGSAAYNLACICSIRQQQDACLETLQLSKECGSLPSIEDMLSDSDLANIKTQTWFVDFVELLKTEPEIEPEIEDDSVVKYDVEGNAIRKKTKSEWKNPEIEVDGVVYDVEGNVVRRIDDEPSNEGVESKTDKVSSSGIADKSGDSKKTVASEKT